jgi:hypothetical protein
MPKGRGEAEAEGRGSRRLFSGNREQFAVILHAFNHLPLVIFSDLILLSPKIFAIRI